MSAREVTQRLCAASAEQVLRQALDHAEDRQVSSINVSFAESASPETMSIFKTAFNGMAKDTPLDGATLNTYRKSGGMPFDESIYFEGCDFVTPQGNGSILDLIKRLNPFPS